MSKGDFEVQIVLLYRYCMLVISMYLNEESLQRSLRDTVHAAMTKTSWAME